MSYVMFTCYTYIRVCYTLDMEQRIEKWKTVWEEVLDFTKPDKSKDKIDI